MKALVTMVVGERYQRRFQQQCYSSWKAYADYHGFDLILFDQPLDHSDRAWARSPAWQKCLAVADDRVKRYDQVAWLDADILISSKAVPSVFDEVSVAEIGVVGDFLYPQPESYRCRLSALEEGWLRQGATVISGLTPQEYYRAFGLPELNQVAQTGVLVLCPESHGDIFRRAYDCYEDRGSAAYHYEMRPLSYEIVNSGCVVWLDPRFNMVVAFGIREDLLEDFTRPYGLADRMGNKLRLALSARQRRLRHGYRQLLKESYFLHFAGRQHEMFLLNSA